MASEETTSKYRRWLPLARNFGIEWLCHQEFADDIIIETSHPDPHVVSAKLSEGIICLADWLEDRGLLLNQSETQVMIHVSEITDIMFRKVLVFVYRCLNAHASLLFTPYCTPK